LKLFFDKEIGMSTKAPLNILCNSLAITALALTVVSCGKAGSKSTTITPSEVLVQLKKIPATQAASFVTEPSITSPVIEIPKVEHAVLRHVYRESINGKLSPFADFLESPNAVVEQHIAFGFYTEISAEEDDSYIIELDDNDLAYFRITNTRPSGRKRVHNFYGVPAGYYMTLDTTDIDHEKNTESSCRNIAVRIDNLPLPINLSARLMINGQVINDAVYEDGQAYQEYVNLCAISQDKDYLLVVAYEDEERDIKYGFNYYKGLVDDDLLEISLDHQADIIEWSSDHQLDNSFSLSGKKDGWSVAINLYHNELQNGMNGYLPKFSMLALESYHFLGRYEESRGGINAVKREFSANDVTVSFDVNQMQIDDINLTPNQISWQSIGQDSEKIVSGIIFDQSLTQTYAFMSMDPDVLRDKQFNFPLDNIELLLESAVSSLVAASGTADKQHHFVSSAALFSGFLYWPSTSDEIDANQLNSDIFISGDGSELLDLLIKELGG